jgi:glycosyltransferase involved in cell wall biosynthesis
MPDNKTIENNSMRDVTVSVIVPTFNRADLIGQTLDAIVAQTFRAWECIVVDDGSTDSTAEVVNDFKKNDSRIRLVKRDSNRLKGANTCRNVGYELSKGTLIKWLDSDDLISSDCLEKQVAALVNGGDVVFCQTDFFRIEKGNIVYDPEKVWGKLQPVTPDPVKDYFFRGLRWQTGAALWRREFLGPKPFEEGLQNSQEWLMHLKYLLKAPQIRFIDERLCHARVHTGSMSNKQNKSGRYYYHQVVARLKGLMLLRDSEKLDPAVVKKIVRFVLWNHLFVFYKLAPLHGLKLLRYYPRLLKHWVGTFL